VSYILHDLGPAALHSLHSGRLNGIDRLMISQHIVRLSNQLPTMTDYWTVTLQLAYYVPFPVSHTGPSPHNPHRIGGWVGPSTEWG